MRYTSYTMRYWMLLLVCILVSCGSSTTPTHVLVEKPELTGMIQSITSLSGEIEITRSGERTQKAAVLFRIHVQNPNDLVNQNMYVIITDQTKIFCQQGDQYIQSSAQDLRETIDIQVFFIGAISTSYPATGTADDVIINQ